MGQSDQAGQVTDESSVVKVETRQRTAELTEMILFVKQVLATSLHEELFAPGRFYHLVYKMIKRAGFWTRGDTRQKCTGYLKHGHSTL